MQGFFSHTDNLYKFLALAGLLLFFLSASALFFATRDIYLTFYLHDQTMDSLSGTRVDTTQSQSQLFQNIGKQRYYIGMNMVEKLRMVCSSGLIIGFILTFFGVYHWYHRVQKHLDVKLARHSDGHD